MSRDRVEIALLKAINRLRKFTIGDLAIIANVNPAQAEDYLYRSGWASPQTTDETREDLEEQRTWRVIPSRTAALIDAISEEAHESSGNDTAWNEAEPFDDLMTLRLALDELEGEVPPGDQRERDLRMAQLYLKSIEVDLIDEQIASDKWLSDRQHDIAKERSRLRRLLIETSSLAAARFRSGTYEDIRRVLIDWSLPIPMGLPADDALLDPIDSTDHVGEIGRLFKAVNGRLDSELDVALWPALRMLRLRSEADPSTWPELRSAAIRAARQNLQFHWANSLVAPSCVLAVVLEAVELADDIFRALRASNALETMDCFSRQLCLASLARLAHSAAQYEGETPNTAASACLFFAAQGCRPEDFPLVIPAALCIEESDARILLVKIARNVFSPSGARNELQGFLDEGAFVRTLGVAMFLRERFDQVGPHINELLRNPAGAALVYMLIQEEHGAVRVRPGDQQIWLQPDAEIKRRYPELARVKIDTAATSPEVNARLQAQVKSRSWESFEVGSLTEMLEESH